MRLLTFFIGTFLIWSTSMAASKSPWSVLFVLDNSGSMKAQTRSLEKELPAFLDQLKKEGVDKFEIALTTTDLFTDEGKLIANANGIKVVSEKLPDAALELVGIVKAVKDTSTSFWEQGLESSYRAVSEEGKTFLKDGQPLAIIYFSDEDDYSCKENCFGAEPENNPNWKAFSTARYVEFFKKLKTERNIDARVYPIVGILEGTCNVASYGVRYLRVRSQIGGIVGSVCNSEFQESLMAVAKDMINTTIAEPPKVLVNPVVLPNAMEDNAYMASLAPFVSGSGTLKFSKISGPAWIVVGADGNLMGTPTHLSLGENVAAVKVCNENGECAEMTVNVTVIHINHSPIWKQDPISLGTIKESQLFAFDLGKFISDPDGDPLSCSAAILPAWMALTPQCRLMGTPQKADVGVFTGMIRVTDPLGMFAEVTITGEVVKK